MIHAIKELNFPTIDGRQYATLTQASVALADMGEKTITTQLRIDGDITPDFSSDWAVEFQGEKYIMPLRMPQGAKGNESLNSEIDLTFQHWAVYQLKRWPFVTIQPIEAGTYIADEEVATVSLNLGDFCELLAQVLQYYYGQAITVDLNPKWQYDTTPTVIEISHTKIWNVLIDAIHPQYGARWEIKPASDNSNTVKGGERYVIRVGYPITEIDHIFEYGFEGGLLKVERQVQSDEIRNMLKGRGGETNIPFRYFKTLDPDNKDFRPDPDWVVELKDIYFPRLMPATFRSYVQGWKAAHINQTDADGEKLYPGYIPVAQADAYSPWAYHKGYTDAVFSPVEFVADEISDPDPAPYDPTVEIRPGYAPHVKKDSSLDKYGPLPDTLDDNDDIYPTLQGTGLDIAVDIEQIESDDVEAATDADSQLVDIDKSKYSALNVPPSQYVNITTSRASFSVPSGKTADLIDDTRILGATIPGYKASGRYHAPRQVDIATSAELVSHTVNVYDLATGQKRTASGIPEGNYYYEIEARVHNLTTDRTLNITVGTEAPKLLYADLDSDRWAGTFEIWIKNVWNSVPLSGEAPADYADRVWRPVLGDRAGNQAKVMFTSGALAHEDYEFTIVAYPVPDTSKTWQEKDADGNVLATHTSHWRLTLAKSDAELEATGLYIPSTKKQGTPGDRFVFIGTEMTHVPYVVDAEKRLDDWKKDQLGEKKEIKPTFVVTTDRVRLNGEGKPDALINQLHVGNSIRLADKRFITPLDNRAYETLYLQSITYTYREPSSDDAALNPDVEIVLGNEYTTSANPVSMMQGEISALQRQVGSISTIEQIVRAIGDKLYLRKDGISDRSISPTQFFSLLTSADFRPGAVGGEGWGFYKDEDGRWVLEVPRLTVREDFLVNTLVINQAEGRGGMEIDTAAVARITSVAETLDAYICYFDQREGTVANLFHVGDIAYCSSWNADNSAQKYYRRRVVAVAPDSVTLTKALDTAIRPAGWPDSGVSADADIPAPDDVIIHYGSYTDPARRFVKVRDVVGGGYERYLDGLDSVLADGKEYYFVGRQAGKDRWFVGDHDGDYAEWTDGELNIRGRINLLSRVGDKPIDQFVRDQAADTALLLDIDNEIIPMACDASGAVIAPYPQPKATLYKGGVPYTGAVTWAVASASGIATATISSSGVLTLSSMTAATATVVISATADSRTLTASVSLYKVLPGADGASYSPNLLKDSEASRTMTAGSTEKYLFTTYLFDNPTPIAAGDTFAVSIEEIEVLAGTPTLFTAVLYNPTDGYISGILQLSLQKPYGTLTATKASTAEPRLILYAGSVSETQGNSVRYAKVMLVKGDTPAAWTPALSEMEGKPGQAAVVYDIGTSAPSVTRHSDGSLSADSVTATKYKTVGADSRTPTTDARLVRQYHYRDGSMEEAQLSADGGPASVSIPVPADAESIVLILYAASTEAVLDRERIPVLADPETDPENLARATTDAAYIDGSTLTGAYAHDVRLYDIADLAAGEKFTVSFDYDVQGLVFSSDPTAPGAIRVIGSPRLGWAWMSSAITANGSGHGVYTFTSVINEYHSDPYATLRFDYVTAGADTTPYVRISNFMVVRGRFEAPWRPAPTDFNYLTQALRNGGSLEGGLMLGSHIKLGYSDSLGVWHEMAGMNGLLRDLLSLRDLAFWAGGKMVDAALDPTAGAAFAVRHDGTGYFADNTVRFSRGMVELGDNLRLTDKELQLLDADGNVRMIISKDSVGDASQYLSDFSTSVTKTFSWPDPTVTTGLGGFAATLDGPEQSLALTTSQATATAGSTVRLDIACSKRFLYLQNQWIATRNLYAAIRVRIVESTGGEYTQTIELRRQSFEQTDEVTYECSAAIRHTVAADCQIQVYLALVPTAGFDTATDFHVTGGIDASARVTIGRKYDQLTKIAADGILSIWPDSAFFVNNDTILARVKNTGLRITESNVLIRRPSSSDWTPL